MRIDFPGFTPDNDGRLWNADETLGLMIECDAVTLLDSEGYPAEHALGADHARYILVRARTVGDDADATIRRWNTYGSWLQSEGKLPEPKP
jgi:hypothetical protein